MNVRRILNNLQKLKSLNIVHLRNINIYFIEVVENKHLILNFLRCITQAQTVQEHSLWI